MKAALLYIIAVLLANLTATLFVPFPIFGQVAIGTLVFGLTFTQRDRMHYRGKPFVYKVIALSALLTLGLLLSFKYLWGPPLAESFARMGWTWFHESADMLISSGTRVFLASVLAILIAESTDTEIYHRLRKRTWLVRVAGSNSVSIPVDSLVFNLVAFAGIFAPLQIASIIFGEIVFKSAVGLVYALFRPRRVQAEEAPEVLNGAH